MQPPDISPAALRDNAAGSGLLGVGMGLLAVGVMMVYSASASVTAQTEWIHRQEIRHLLFAVAALAVMGLLWRMDYRRWARGGAVMPAGILLAAAVVLTAGVMVPGLGVRINGARRWYRLGLGRAALSFQPSELLKLALVVFLACWLGREGRNNRSFKRTFVPAAGLLAVCAGVVATEDFGTAALIGLVTVVVLFLARVPWWHILTLIPPAAAGFYLLVVRVPSRWARIVAFIHPWRQTPATYQGRQALIAIGSGGLWGKGLGNGTLKLGFLPEDCSDFVFAVICEELGFFGAAMVLALLGLFLVLAWRVAVRSDGVGRLLAGGLGAMIGLQSLLHVSVNVGSAPPTGVGLPLVSAGGTGLVATAAAVAMIISVSARWSPATPVAPGARGALEGL